MQPDNKPIVNIIVAVGKDGAIGKNGDLAFHISEDLRRFKKLTMGHPVIMGRKTWESLPKKPLPGRKNIIITRNSDYPADNAFRAESPEMAIKSIMDEKESEVQLTGNENEKSRAEVFIIGGAEVYKTFLPLADKLYLTLIDSETPDADAYFSFNPENWIEIDREGPFESKEGLSFSFITLKRKDSVQS